MVAHTCNSSYKRDVWRRITVWGQLGKITQDPMWKITTVKKEWGHGSPGRVPAQQVWGPEFENGLIRLNIFRDRWSMITKHLHSSIKKKGLTLTWLLRGWGCGAGVVGGRRPLWNQEGAGMGGLAQEVWEELGLGVSSSPQWVINSGRTESPPVENPLDQDTFLFNPLCIPSGFQRFSFWVQTFWNFELLLELGLSSQRWIVSPITKLKIHLSHWHQRLVTISTQGAGGRACVRPWVHCSVPKKFYSNQTFLFPKVCWIPSEEIWSSTI
jgi:hypothetical protein